MGQARIPTEHDEQSALIAWARLSETAHPELRLLIAIPNGGARMAVTGARLKAEGVRPGVPDLFFAHPSRNGYHGLWIEMKRAGSGRVSPEQRSFLSDVRAAGYCAVIAYTWLEAARIICQYAGWEEPAL